MRDLFYIGLMYNGYSYESRFLQKRHLQRL